MRNLFNKAALIAIVASAATLGVIASPNAVAASKTASFDVTLTVQDDCSVSANALDFGSTGVLDKNLDGNSSLSVTCTKGTAYNVALDAGTSAGSTVADRTMSNTSGDAFIGYNLYRDVGRTQVWGNTTGTDTYAGTGNGNSQSIPVFGRVQSQATPAPGAYSSTITATVVF